MPDLHTALEAAITARLWLATTATPGPWVVGGQGRRELRHPNGELFCVGVDDGERARWVADTWDGPDAAHIALHDPDDAVRRYQRDLKVLKRHYIIWRDIGWLERDGNEIVEGSAELPVCVRCVPRHSSFGSRAEVPEGPCAEITDLLDVYPEVTRP